MGPWNKKCAIMGCEDRNSPRHRFPLPNKFPDRFKMWLETTGNSTLMMKDKQLIYRSERICDVHFADHHRGPNRTLTVFAIPTKRCPIISSSPVEILTTSGQSKDVNFPSTSAKDHTYSIPTTVCQSAEIHLPSTSSAVTYETPSTCLQGITRKKKFSFTLLKELGVNKTKNLTVREAALYNRAKKISNSFSMYKRRNQSKKRFTMEETINNMTKDLDPHVANFLKLQIKASKFKPKGRRYNLEEKVLGLILQRQSPKSYKLFGKLFATPSKNTLNHMLNRIPIDAGINETIFRNLKQNVAKLSKRDKVCILMFDEMALQPHLDLNAKNREFDGFVDCGDERNNKFADHAQVFMIKGITKKWKQPVAYTFSQGTTTTIDLVRQIKGIIVECEKAGLTVVATVSDQGSTNVGAINYLVKYNASQENTLKKIKLYEINGHPIVHIYDPPHLLKGIRNNLMTKKLFWKKNNNLVIGDWADIVMTYEIDNDIGRFRALNKIHKGHVYAKYMKKMKVSHAAQVFSHTMASIMNLFLRKGVSSNDGKLVLQRNSLGTVSVLQFFDSLFDSVNGHTLYPSAGKKLKCAVKEGSGHINFWNTAKQHLSIF
ncbi:uncharacterized protein [Diabrotica undecimpunctata]|uniref:uncharacterized protein n=1 Tax=Diabrotica undecimpunctata TaxID=50387 RepID=UPI003B641BC1